MSSASWIRADFDFGARGVNLIVGERDAEEVFGLVRELADTPEKLADQLRALIDRCRPDLAGATIWCMQFSTAKRAWEILIEHPSLQPRAMYEEAPTQRLRLEETTLADYRLKDLADRAITVSP
jgi:hypothetical protein